MAVPLMTDEDVRRTVDMADAVRVMEQAFRELVAKTLVAPPRLQADLEVGKLVFTTGAVTADPACLGFRVYDVTQLHSPGRDELTAVFNSEDGALKGIVVGPLLGAVRTGAIGGVAVKWLSRDDSRVLGIMGAGYQARTQLRAALSVRDFSEVRICSRSSGSRDALAAEAATWTAAAVTTCKSPRDVVEASDVLICATASSQPVFEAAWLHPGMHISTIGPKFHSASELEIDVAAKSALLTTDSPAQAAAFGDDFILHGTEHNNRLIALSDIVTGRHPGRQSADEITLFYSLGLAGTEVLLADRLFQVMAEKSDETPPVT